MNFRRLLFITYMFFLAVNTFAARGKQDTYQVYINAPEQSIRANVLTGPAKIVAEVDRTYYWYASNRIMETKGGFDGKLLHGEYTSFYLNNNLKEKGMFRKGLKHGRWITWYDNGKIKDISEWKNGKKDGIYRSFTSQGEPVLEARFVNDRLHGKVTSYEGGKILSSKKYKNGEEVIKQPKAVKEKKSRKKETEKNKPETKEGVNTITPISRPEEKRSFKEKLRSFFTPKKDKDEKQKSANNTEDKKAAKKEKSNKDEKLPSEKKQKKKKTEKEQEK